MNQASRTTNAVRNVAVSTGGQIGLLILSFVNRTVFLQMLSTEYLGLNGLFTNILSFLSLAELGVGSSILYSLYRPIRANDEQKIAQLMNYFAKIYRIIGITIFLIGLLLIPFFPYLLGDTSGFKENIVLIYLIYLFNTASTYFFSYKQTIINADQKYFIINMATLVTGVIQTSLQLIVLIVTHNYIVYLLCILLCTFLLNIGIAVYADKKYSFIHKYKKENLPREERKIIFNNVRYIMVSKLSGVLVNNSDNIIIAAINGLTEVGLLSNYTMIINAFNQILNQVFNSLTASVGNLNANEHDKENSFKIFKVINLLNFWFYGFTAIGFCLMANELITLWIGEVYCLPVKTIYIIALNYYLIGMQNAIWLYKNTMGLFRYGRYILFFTAAINIVLSIELGKIMGLFGILVATVIARLLTNVWYDPWVVFRRGFKKNIKVYLGRYIFFACSLLIAGSATSLFMRITITYNPHLTFIIHFIECLIIPNVIFIVIFFKLEEFGVIHNLAYSFVKKIYCRIFKGEKH